MTNERWDMREDTFSMQRDPGHNAAELNGTRSDNGIANREGVEAGKRGFAAAPSSDIHGQDDALLDVTEVAEYLRISRSSVYKLIERQQIPAIRIGRLVRFRRRDVTVAPDPARTGSQKAAQEAHARPTCVSSRWFEQKEHRKLSSLSIGSAHAF